MNVPRLSARAAAIVPLAMLLVLAAGCFSERSFPMQTARITRLSDTAFDRARVRTAREWLVAAHAQLADRLPREEHAALLTEDLVADDGQPADLLAHFRIDPEQLQSVVCNFDGILHTAQASGADSSDAPTPPSWDGFEDIWIPIDAEHELAGRLGLARRGAEPLDADCVIILPGLFGDNAVLRTRDIALALRASGVHVLALELRGMGRTDQRFPEVYYTFGVLETCELIAAARWLERKPFVRDTGLIGFCWGANHALLAAWSAGSDLKHPSITERMRPYLRPRPERPVFQAGVLAFSPVLRFEQIVEACQTERTILEDPVLSRLQQSIAGRMRHKRHPEVSGSLRNVIQFEYDNTFRDYPDSVEDGLRFLRLLEHCGKPDFDKLESARGPVLIVQAANDPLTSCQNVADLIAQTSNPNVAALVLPGGGHVGFAPYAADYFYSLILNFFDAARGVAASTGAR